jgi:hypothetical protein
MIFFCFNGCVVSVFNPEAKQSMTLTNDFFLENCKKITQKNIFININIHLSQSAKSGRDHKIFRNGVIYYRVGEKFYSVRKFSHDFIILYEVSHDFPYIECTVLTNRESGKHLYDVLIWHQDVEVSLDVGVRGIAEYCRL